MSRIYQLEFGAVFCSNKSGTVPRLWFFFLLDRDLHFILIDLNIVKTWPFHLDLFLLTLEMGTGLFFDLGGMKRVIIF